MDSEYFQNRVKEIRKEYKIPNTGLKMSKEVEEELNKQIHHYFHLPEELKTKDRNILKEINLYIRDICKKLTIENLDLMFFFRIYILYNKKIYTIINGKLSFVDLCQTQDMIDFATFFGADLPEDKHTEHLKRNFEYYPIIIKLHPSVSQRDLVGYIKDNWDSIEYSLSQYKDENSKIGKVKKKKLGIKERNDFIYENRHLSSREIMGMLYKKYGFNFEMDQAYIGKIISMEKKRRKEL